MTPSENATPGENPKLTFPSRKTIERIATLKKVNSAPTQFKGMTAAEIANEIVKNLGGEITIDVSKAPEAEREPVRDAANIMVDGVLPVITILGDTGESEADDIGFTEENLVLREINREILGDNGNEINIGRAAFREFIRAMLEDPENYPLVRDEWNKFIVGHDTTGKIDTPYESHHLPNIGLRRKSEGEDSLRDEVTGFVKGIMEGVRDKVAAIFEKGEMLDHANAGMNTPDARSLALGLGTLSNLVRGAGLYRHRLGEDSLDKYAPRRLAADMIDKVTQEAEKANG